MRKLPESRQQSIFQETMLAFFKSVKTFWLWILSLSILLTALNLVLKPNDSEFRDALATNNKLQQEILEEEKKLADKSNAEEHSAIEEKLANNNKVYLAQSEQLIHLTIREFLPSFVAYMVFYFLLMGIAAYLATVEVLQSLMKRTPPVPSISGFGHWLAQISWKYTRPALWLLIPVFGIFMYIRAILRYAAVSPLAVLKRSPELNNSWKVTENNTWRILGTSLSCSLVLAAPLFIIGMIYLMPQITVNNPTTELPANQQTAILLLQNLFTSAAIVLDATYACTVYRILVQEKNALVKEPTII